MADEIIVKIENYDIKILTSRSAQANASLYFDKAKECERKAKRTEQIIIEKPKKAPRKKKPPRKLEWFEKYRYL